MILTSRRRFLSNSLAACACATIDTASSSSATEYICPPCGCSMDGKIFDAPGICPACKMKLVARPSPLSSGLQDGAGSFNMKGGKGHEDKTIAVFFYKPKAFTHFSKILIVVPGAGRNASDYRDAWIEPAEAHNWLVLSPSYAERDYDFAAYQMCGIIKNLRLPPGINPDSAVVTLRDEDIQFELNQNRDEWLFNDFDRLFLDVVSATRSQQTTYDLFGHSAGGQILHRLALFQGESKARRIVACNSGFYTLPDFNFAQPFGLQKTLVTEADLQSFFQRDLIIGVGVLDSSNEAGGIQLHTPIADAQGFSRLDRGRYFFDFSRRKAEAIGAPFNWRLEIVEGVGHDNVGMSKALVDRIRS